MSNENVEVQNEVSGPQLEFIDIINATKIMEAAIARNAFNVKELAEVAQIVSRFQDFSAAILAEQEKNAADQTEVEGE